LDRFDRVYELHKILASRRTPISRRELEDRMECKRATVARTIEFLRDRLNAPVEYDHQRNGYFYRQDEDGPWQLPGLWFNAAELHALLTSHELLGRIQPGVLDEALQPALNRIRELLEQRRLGARNLVERVRILQMTPRPVDVQQFRRIADALAERRRLHAFYHGRARDETTERDISPQRLVYYRDNWYLDAWCHRQKGLRTFSLDRLHVVDVLDEAAVSIPDDKLDRVLGSAYGIFAGEPRDTAVLHFTASAARWVADEQWHPDQDSQVFPDGSMELRVPYADPRELVQDILRHGPEVEVVGPKSLRTAVAERLEQALKRYR
jgi:proteasome accessory factor C